MLHRVFAVAACLIASLATGISIQVTSAQSTSWTPELSLTIKRIPTVLASPDGTKVALAVSEAAMEGATSEWLSQIHVANADGTDSRQLTRGDKSATLPRWSPDGKWIGFITSRSGSANVWRISVAGGEAEQVTNEKGGVRTFDWSPQGSSVAFIMPEPKSDQEEKDEKEKRDWRTIDENLKLKGLYVQSVEPDANRERKPRKLTTANYSVEEFDWSPDGRAIAFRHQPTSSANDWTKSDISVVTVETNTTRPLVSTAAAEVSPRFSPDGSRIAFVASQTPVMWAATDKVLIVPTAGGLPQPLTDTFDQQPVILDWASDGTAVLVSEVNRTVPTVYALPVNGGPPVRIATTHISAPAVNARASHLAFVSQDYDKAPEAFVAKLGGSFSAVQVSPVQPRIDAPIGRSEVLTWKSFDGQTIEGVVTYPVNYAKGTRAPLLVIIHGGPTGVFANTFVGSIGSPHPVAVFAARGYAVLRVNPRGSSGYGQRFRYANMRDWGGGDYKDIMTGVDHLIGLGIADPDRLGVMGWSYGGFMTSWIVTQTQRFKAASAGAAVTNLVSFTGTSDISDFIPNYFGGEFWNTFEDWRAHSPVLNVRGVKTPTLIQHGEADVRVPITQSYEFYQALKRQGVPTKMTIYPRQPHGFLEPKMTLDAAKANLEWFDRFVKGTVAVTSAK